MFFVSFFLLVFSTSAEQYSGGRKRGTRMGELNKVFQISPHLIPDLAPGVRSTNGHPRLGWNTNCREIVISAGSLADNDFEAFWVICFHFSEGPHHSAAHSHLPEVHKLRKIGLAALRRRALPKRTNEGNTRVLVLSFLPQIGFN